MSTEKQLTSTVPDRRAPQRRYLGVVLVVYWVTMFTATHIPLPKLPGDVPGSDKLLHFLGYGGLGLMLGLWRAFRAPLSWPVLLLLWGILAAYGALDEWLQQFVNRQADVNDWFADVLGATLGLAIAWFLQRLWPLEGGKRMENGG